MFVLRSLHNFFFGLGLLSTSTYSQENILYLYALEEENEVGPIQLHTKFKSQDNRLF